MSTRLSIALALSAALVLPSLAGATEPDTVIINLDEFLDLYQQAQEPDVPDPTAPRAYTVSSASYVGDVLLDDGEPASALFEGTLRIEVLQERGWVQVPILPATVAVRSATVGGKEAATWSDGSWLYLVTDKRGAFDVVVEFATSVFSSEGSSSLSFQPTPAGAMELSLSVPAADALDFVVAGARLKSDTTRGDRRIVDAVLPGNQQINVRWQREIPDTVAEEAIVYAEVFSLVGLGEGLLTERTTVSYTILQAGIEQVSLQIPDGATLIDVQGSGIRDWSVGADSKLTVDLNFAAEGSWTLSLQLESKLDGDAIDAPLPEPLDVDRAKGWVGVEAIGTLEVAPDDTATGDRALSATPIDVRMLPGAILGVTSNPILLAYKYLGSGASLPLQVTQHEDVEVLVTLLDVAEATTMFTADGRRLTSVQYRVRNNRKQFLRLALPEGAELWSAQVAGKSVQPARAADGRILIPLVRSQSAGGALADFQVAVVYVEEGQAPGADGKGTFEAQLPTADVPITYVAWTVYAPWDAKVKKKSYDGSVRHVSGLSRPLATSDMLALAAGEYSDGVSRGGIAQHSGGGLGTGAVPVAVSVPVEGRPIYFEKLLALGEDLEISFDYRGLK